MLSSVVSLKAAVIPPHLSVWERLRCGFHCDYFLLAPEKPHLSVRFSHVCPLMLGKFFPGFLCALQRRDIVTGVVEPTDEECEWTSDREEEDALAVSAR